MRLLFTHPHAVSDLMLLFSEESLCCSCQNDSFVTAWALKLAFKLAEKNIQLNKKKGRCGCQKFTIKNMVTMF